MENFFSYISKPVESDEFEFWVDTNNICFLKMELFRDFVISLVGLVGSTYLGDEQTNETNIRVTQNDNLKHFEWCWKKTLENFRKEGILFEPDGEHFDFMKSFLMETFYQQTSKEVKMSLSKFFSEVFNLETMFTKSDLDLLTTLYKSLEKNMKVNLH
jgi:hypothetical protein